MNQKRCLILISLRHLLFITILRNIKEVNEIMRFLYPEYRRNRLSAQHAGGGYNDQSNYCSKQGQLITPFFGVNAPPLPFKIHASTNDRPREMLWVMDDL